MLRTLLICSLAYLVHASPRHLTPAAQDAPTIQPTCEALPTTINSSQDFRAKVRSASGTCSPYEGFFHIAARASDDDYSCNQNKPCSNGACCAKTGYCGYGPDSCGTDGNSPNDKCWSNCGAKAACGQFSESGDAKCPLNVCCSEFGFCGTTGDFCGKGCQSNCNQPSSTGSGGDVQKRVMGYYEGWNANENCIGMGIKDIPVSGLTHLHLAFASLTSNFDVVPMDGLSTDLFKDITDLKKSNLDLRVIASVGGWTFSDNGTSTQSIFPDMVSSSDKRSMAINKMIAFLRQFGFDGVDYDWEYPGAPDRGGQKDDGVNFTEFLKELRIALNNEPNEYTISFTAPTSYWYLRHFDIKASTDAVNWVNVMSYDLHGVWDANDPIGNQVLAHTNLTEINDALNLFWRNEVPAGKLNLGLGFYGRSFQLADPGCSSPGCLFKAGASPGPCTKNSGTLSYAEIVDVMDKYSITPVYDKENAVKYITWNQDQWVSFDDQDTFQQKIKYANDKGLGGLLIWAIDLDTTDLRALQGVLYPNTFSNLQADSEAAADNWNDVNGGLCRATTCGVTSCNVGEVLITKDSFQCDDSGKRSVVCCPLAAAPDPAHCSWQGQAPLCDGQCLVGQVTIASSLWGDGQKCSDGRKFFCCDIENKDKRIECSWNTNCGSINDKQCADDEYRLTWRNDACWGAGVQSYCCKNTVKWNKCKWHGKQDSCFDNHCDEGNEVVVANSHDAEGTSCGIAHPERTRVLCCDPPDEESNFLPVELDWLFPHPPPLGEAKSEDKLKTDPTYGGANTLPVDNDPEEASFGFVVLTSPDTIQTSLDKRDGSHWELFDCFDSVSENEQTIRMICTDDSENSNCDRIYLGNGVPGTILEMPQGCGPGKYAVAVDMTLSANQALPDHLIKRDIPAGSKVYDLKFDYDFARVPRDLGDTQMRIDVANEPGYWDSVVNKAAGAKRKRSLDEHRGNHKRWLEEAWREDKHLSGLSQEELHKRWFGDDVISWLKGIFNGVTIEKNLDRHHSYTDDFTAILLREQLTCPLSSTVTASGRLDITANVHVGINTNFGLTIIATLGEHLDLSNSYLYFRNDGEVSAKFTLDAVASVKYDSKDFTLFSADKFGAAFSVPGIVVIGPNFKLLGRVEAGLTASAHLEAQVNIAKWNVQQMYPDAASEYDPKALSDADPGGTQDVTGKPVFDASVSADGYITAHIKPVVTFGIDFNTNFIPIDPAAVSLVADGYVTAYASATGAISNGGGSTETSSSFCYGVDAGASLYVNLSVPTNFGWHLPQTQWPIGSPLSAEIIPETCLGQNQRRDILSNGSVVQDEHWEPSIDIWSPPAEHPQMSLAKRGQVYGPIIKIPSQYLQCPGAKVADNSSSAAICQWCIHSNAPPGHKREVLDGNNGTYSDFEVARRDGSADQCLLRESGTPGEEWTWAGGSLATKRSLNNETLSEWDETFGNSSLHTLYERSTTRKTIRWESGNALYSGQPIDFGTYPGGSNAVDKVRQYYTYDPQGPVVDANCNGRVAARNAKALSAMATPPKFETDHIFEAQTVVNFFLWARGLQRNSQYTMPSIYTAATDDFVSKLIVENANTPKVNGQTVMSMIRPCIGNNANNLNGLALLDAPINNFKGKLFQLLNNALDTTIQTTQQETHEHYFNRGGTFSYLKNTEIWGEFQKASKCVEKVLYDLDQEIGAAQPAPAGKLGTPAALQPPPGSNGQVHYYGFRDLYCGYIDKTLEQIEGLGRNFANNAKTAYDAAYSGRDADIFSTVMFGSAGILGSNAFSLDTGAGTSSKSKYGVWGSSDLPDPKLS